MSISEIALYNAVKTKLGSKLDAKSDNLLTKTDKLDLIDRMNKAKTETIVWIDGIGVIQFVLAILSKKFL